MTRILVLGMSHVMSLTAAWAFMAAESGNAESGNVEFGDTESGDAEPGPARFEIVNLRTAPDIFEPDSRILRLDGRSWQHPDVVCLALEGNLHNVFNLLKTPERFRLGDAESGSVPVAAVPDDPDCPAGGWFVPRDMLRALFKRRLKRLDIWTDAIHARFPKARFIHICAPPPVLALPPLPDPAERRADQNVMMYFMGFDASPPLLRMKIFDVQTDIYAELAARHGAVFLAPPAMARMAGGFLDPAYWDNDPTHGNTAYGRLVIDQITMTAHLLHQAHAQASG